MGCCGEPIDKAEAQELNRAIPFETKAINQQPSPQPGIQWQQEKQPFQLPNVPTPPPVLQYGLPQQRGSLYDTSTQAQSVVQQWTQSQQLSAYGTPGYPQLPSSPTMFGSEAGKTSISRSNTPSTYVANPLNAYSPPITQPTTAHHVTGMSISGRGTASPPQISGQYVPPVDEGKLSVSIDFGECHCQVLFMTFRISNCGFRYHVFGSGETDCWYALRPTSQLSTLHRPMDLPVSHPGKFSKY